MTDEKEIKIESINLVIGKKEISLSLEEARKLKNALDELFQERNFRNTYPVYIPYDPVRYPSWTTDIVYMGSVAG